FRLNRQIDLTSRTVVRFSFRQFAVYVFRRSNGVCRGERPFDFFIVQQQRHRCSKWLDLRKGISPPARSIFRRNSGAGEPSIDFPELRFVTAPFAMSTRSRSPVSTKSWMPGIS